MVNIQWDSKDRSFVLRTSVVLQRSRESLFDFFSDAFQLEQRTPDWLNFRILTIKASGRLGTPKPNNRTLARGG